MLSLKQGKRKIGKKEVTYKVKYNILCINGSPHGKYGNTHELVNRLINKFQNANLIKNIKNYNLVDMNIKECRGCTSCMRRGKCPLQNKDDVEQLVEELLRTDVVIFASPIYVLNITGYLKKFIDRTAYITHRLILEGKKAIFVLSSQGLGDEQVAEYMKMVMEAMGMQVVGGVVGNVFFHKVFVNEEKINSEIENIIVQIQTSKPKENKNISEEELVRRKKFKSLMQQEKISKKLFKEDYKYWQNKR